MLSLKRKKKKEKIELGRESEKAYELVFPKKQKKKKIPVDLIHDVF